MRVSILLLLLLVVPDARAQNSSAGIQNPVAEALQAATQQFRAGDRDAALSAVQALAEANPDNPGIFSALGQFRRQTGELDASLTAFRRAADLDPEAPGAQFILGVAYALADRIDEAYDALLSARSGGTGQLLWTAVGTDANGQLGNVVEAAGDVDRDGVPDVVAGAPYAGKAVVYSGRDGKRVHDLVSEDSTGAFGASVRGVGDADGDGFADVAVGEPYQMWGAPVNGGTLGETAVSFGAMFMSVMGDANGDGTADIYVSDWADAALGPSTGRIYVFSGADGHTLLEVGGETAGDGFGIGVSDAGDVDFLVTSAWSGIRGFRSGRTLVISGRNPEATLDR